MTLCVLMSTALAFGQYFADWFFPGGTQSAEKLNGGIRTTLNLSNGVPFMVGTGVNYAGTATGMKNIRFVRVNNAGSVLSNNFYNVTDFTNPALTFDSEGMALAEVSSSTGAGAGYVATGDSRGTSPTGVNSQDLLIAQFTAAGALTTGYRVELGGEEVGTHIIRSRFIPNRFFICGNTTNPNGITRPFVVSITGAVINWACTYNGFPSSVVAIRNITASKLVEDPNTGNLYVVGSTQGTNTAGLAVLDAMILGVNSATGASLGMVSYDLINGANDAFNSIKISPNGNYVIAGTTNGGTGMNNMFVGEIPANSFGPFVCSTIMVGTDPNTGNIMPIEGHDVTSRINTAGIIEHYVFGPGFTSTGIVNWVYRQNCSATAAGTAQYNYGPTPFNTGFAIDNANPGIALFSSEDIGFGPTSCIRRTYYNGANVSLSCGNLCPNIPPITLLANPLPTQLQVTSVCGFTRHRIKATAIAEQFKRCNKTAIACGSNAKTTDTEETIETLADNLSVSPNPTTANLQITYSTPTPTTHILQVYDMTGRLTLTQTIVSTNGTNSISLNVGTLTNGTYIARLFNQADGTQQVVKFVKQ